MKKNPIALLAGAVILLAAWSCAKDMAAPGQESQVSVTDPEELEAQASVKGVMNIRLSEELAEMVENDLAGSGVVTKSSSPALSGLYSSLGIVSMQRLFPYAGEYEERTRREGLHRWYVVEFDPSVSVTKASAGFSAVEGIEIAETVPEIKQMAVFNDPNLSSQWHYDNDGSLSGATAGADINVVPVWENYTTGSNKVIVAVVDGGIDVDHPDLAGNLWTDSKGAHGYNFVDGTSAIVPQSHGTHVAGTIGAVNNNGIGVAGVAGGNSAKGVAGVRLMSCQTFSDNGSGDSARAIKWAADNGAVIANNSWGYIADIDNNGVISSAELERIKNLQISEALKTAVDYFIKYAGCDNNGNQLADSPMKGGVVIFSAGNDNIQYGPPANYEAVIAVGAIGAGGKKSSYSCYGDWVDICAPGGDGSNSVFSTNTGSSYVGMQGTSMACPHVTGVAALIASYYGGPGFTNEMLKERLLGGTNPDIVPKSANIGELVDALGAFTYGSTTPPDRVTEYTVEGSANNIIFSWNVGADSDDGKAYGYLLLAAREASLLSNLDIRNIPSSVAQATVLVGDAALNDPISGTISGLEFSTDYYVTIAAFDYAGNYSALASVKSVSTAENNPPVISLGDMELPIEVRAHQTLRVPVSIVEPDGHRFSVSYTAGGAADTWNANLSAGEFSITIVGNADEPGNYTASITATDSYGISATLSIPYIIHENHAPEVVGELEDLVFSTVGEREVVDLSSIFYDEDGETLALSVSNTAPNVVHANISGSSVHITVLGMGNATVTITATDARGLSVSASIRVLVKDPDSSLELYPNPVVDNLYVRTLDEMDTNIRIVASDGSLVYEETRPVSGFEPAVIDMSACAPGRYSVYVSYGGDEYIRQIVKR